MSETDTPEEGQEGSNLAWVILVVSFANIKPFRQGLQKGTAKPSSRDEVSCAHSRLDCGLEAFCPISTPDDSSHRQPCSHIQLFRADATTPRSYRGDTSEQRSVWFEGEMSDCHAVTSN